MGPFLGVVDGSTVTFPALDGAAYSVEELERQGGPPIAGIRHAEAS